MFFNSFEFALFFPAVLILYWTVPRRWQNPLLLVASYVFYGAWDWRFLGLLLLSTVTDYFVALRLEREQARAQRRRLLGVSLAINLGVLAFFKYFDFFVGSAAGVLNSLGLNADHTTLRIVLPVGISFYTFQSLAYAIDVYREKAPTEHRFATFALYVAYFPQLVAGPIERSQRLIPQLSRSRSHPTYEQIRSGAFLILLGLFKKIAIADALAPYVDRAFSNAATAGWLELLIGVYAFAIQIYGDFSGYSDIARGCSRLLGIELMINFDQPYLSRNVTNFWRTWHISLSSWLRDYLYIPLGGNRKGASVTYRNLIVTMLLGGLWHGAGWTFVAWGGLHGLYVAAHRRFRTTAQKGATDPLEPRDIVPAFLTFQLVCLAWIFFRAETFGHAFDVLTGILTLRPGAPDLAALALLVIGGSIVLRIDLLQRNAGSHTVAVGWKPVARGATYALLLLGIVVFSGPQRIPFIYFQF
jgi:alginate O-acetyltransferase complex protein AlgI